MLERRGRFFAELDLAGVENEEAGNLSYGSARGSLSGGERQMLALGMGLVPEPSLLLLDEPSTGLSPLLTDRMLEEIKSLKQRLGCTVLLIEQNVKNAIAISDRVVILRRGKIEYEYAVTPGGDAGALLDAYSFKGS
jgi:branched-chain amino acid transport system ATP-binding protein